MKSIKLSIIGFAIISSLMASSLLIMGDTVFAVENSCVNLSQTLRYGGLQRKEDVVVLQNFLYSKGYISTSATGYFGKLTESALKKFQKDNSIDQNGIAGPLTRAKIKNITCTVVVKPQTNQTASVIAGTFGQNTSQKVEVVSPKVLSLPYSTSNLSDWSVEFGKISTTTGTMSMEATSDLTIAQVYYKPAQDLKDYSYSANVFVKRGVIILMARYINDKNFVGCAFVGKNIDIIQRVNGVQKTLVTAHLPDSPYTSFFFDDLNLTMSVKGRTVGCTLLGKEVNVEYKEIDETLLKGSVGAQVWYESPGVASAELRNVVVKSI